MTSSKPSLFTSFLWLVFIIVESSAMYPHCSAQIEDTTSIPIFDAHAKCSKKNMRILFPHAPKCGGRTIEATFGSHMFKFLLNEPRTHKLETTSIIRGHHVYDALVRKVLNPNEHGSNFNSTYCIGPYHIWTTQDLMKREPHDTCLRMMFFMRNPIDRTLSAFYTQTGRSKGGHFSCLSHEASRTVMQNISSTIDDWVKLLDAHSLQKLCLHARIENVQTEFLVSGLAIGRLGTRLALAKARLKAMPFFGLQEYFDESMQLMSYTFDIDLKLYTPIFNLNKYGKTMSEKALLFLQSINDVDVQLYDYAKELFFERLKAMKDDLKKRNQISQPFTCDKNIICGKNSRQRQSRLLKDWEGEIASLPPDKKMFAKRLLLCGPRNGCARNATTFSST